MEKEAYYKVAVIILVAALAVVIIQNQMMLSELGKDKKEGNNSEAAQKEDTAKAGDAKTGVSEKEILGKLKQFPELKPYENHTAEITRLNEENLTNLAKNQPVIYKDVKAGAYQVVFKSDSVSLLVIYDYHENKILKEFELQNIKI